MDRIILKQCPSGEAIAFIPDAPANPGMILSYMHIGQHGEEFYDFYLACRPLSPFTTAGRALLRELRRIGYKPKLIHRINRKGA